MTTLADALAYDPDKVKPGWIAFFLVMTLIVATFLLWRSMNTQLGKIRVPPRASLPRGGDGPPVSEPDGEPSPPAPPTSPRLSDEEEG